ncbi:MAG: TIGR03560 family F420-dependent LLM class oxidoreductase [Actinomycetota bacterium]|nr:TIGR03560 family F420-dependent LLM class oxidoreductase [Actinomycetota bacterium]
MRFGLDCSQHQQTWDEIVDRVRFAEDAGFEGAWVFDHFKAMYGDPKGPCFEAWTLLAGLAAKTSRVRLGTLVTGITYRPPSILATEAVTIDHISNGRIELAVGAAWFEVEHRELGIRYPPNAERARRLEEAVLVMKLLMTEDDASFDGRFYRLEGASYNPKPVQDPHPPLWIGANGEKLMLPIVGRHAGAWHGFGDADDLRRKFEIISRAAEKAGRNPETILRSTSLSLSEPLDEVRRNIERFAEAGVGYLVASWPSEGKERLDEFIETVMPEFAEA